jgi:pimeloyl-ACP methyl ester carboxylesterase
MDMKLGKLVSTCGITVTLAISDLSLLNLGQQAQAQTSTGAFTVFVNGSGDCCAESMFNGLDRIRKGVRGDLWATSYASFRNGSTTRKVGPGLSVDPDINFVGEAVQVINNIPPNRPIVLVGHSYGGDSILKVLPLIARRIQLVVVIDPVGTAGFRSVATKRVVPKNVDYFMNRWQENGLAARNAVPFDSRGNGKIPCLAKVCDQQAANLARNTDGSEIRISCEAHEASCDGWRLPGCNFRGCWRGSNGTKAKRMYHNDMPVDAHIEETVIERIKATLRPFRVLK